MKPLHPTPEPCEAIDEPQGCTGWALVVLMMASGLLGLFLAWVCQ